ncbi:MAG: transcription-repair coupling factor [Balneola sp.]|nr:transcription-repair coupling factor [Balneola sp.]HBX67717.1 transcription-repair coupling factor [Balneolaceae bacterium]|tara:strand:- start:3477 stop:6821 length:3345 start_codon:yes stop_codon:yes gene_type:complete
MSISLIKEQLRKNGIFERVFDQIEDQKKLTLKKSIGALNSFLLNALSNKKENVLVISETDEGARFLKADLDVISNEKAVVLYPSSNRKPYDQQQLKDTSLLVQRSEALQSIADHNSKIVITSVEAIGEKIAPPSTLNEVSLVLEKGQEVDLDKFKEQLVEQGYNPVKFVDEPGEFAVRGGILDIFPFSGEYPLRLEFFGDELDTIREFDADSQRSIAFLNQARIIPDLTNLPETQKSSFLSYFDENTLLVTSNKDLIITEVGKRYEKAEEAFEDHSDNENQLLPEELYLSEQVFEEELSKFTHQLFVANVGASEKDESTITLETKPQPDFHGNFKLLRENITKNSSNGLNTIILCDNDGQRDRFEELLGEASQEFKYLLVVESLHEGFIYEPAKLAVYTDHQIFNRYHRPKTKRRRFHGGISFKELKDLSIGDYVVHVDYGIGKFRGFKKINVKNTEQEVVVLQYKDDSTLYVNVSSLHKLQKYSGKEGTAPRITKLGSGAWARKKAQTKKKVKDIARELIQLYAKRKAETAHDFSADNEWQTELEANFEFEETPDQYDAIVSVKNDMESKHPMDRLVCGDVGFGKTEVAVRAAFKAVLDHKQVAVLVPTTILAEQHAKTFMKRMEKFPVKIEALSRFRSAKEQKEAIKKLAEGEVDIVIGTHRLLSKDVKFKDLGLIIVDEEQRFGVSAKEKLKSFRASVDVLTLTATPIPRTLQFSLMGARDLSVINTPPPNRQPVYTEIHSFDEELIRDAILQEISRGGQVFFIHNRVKNIEETAEMIRRLAPDIRVRFGHGQMTGSQLDKIITDFYQHKFDVLVSTNIVENGIDIANANTIIINQANNFGLAELHQLRGRVGRSNRKAFCYLITNPIQTLSTEARKRLLALEEFSDLGSGFNIAMRDLDIRGAGDILGGEQSGFINDIGFDLYTKILNDAVKELKQSEFSDMFDDVEIEAELPETTVESDETALLPQDYVTDNVERLNLYRKLSQAKTEKEIEEWKEEIEDRFGPAPKEANYLIGASKVRLFASQNFFTKVTIRADRMWLVCPKQESEMGKNFFDSGKFQEILEKLEATKKDKFQVVQKKDTVRFVVQEIPDIQGAFQYLKELAMSELHA